MKLYRITLAVLLISAFHAGLTQDKPFFLDAGSSFNTSKTTMIDRDASMALGVFVKPGFLISDDWLVSWKIEPAAKVHGIAENEGAGFKYGSNFMVNNYFVISRILRKKKVSWDYGVSGLMIYDYRFNTEPRPGGFVAQVRNHRLFPGFGVHGGALIGKFKIDVGYYLPLKGYVGFAGFGMGYRF